MLRPLMIIILLIVSLLLIPFLFTMFNESPEDLFGIEVVIPHEFGGTLHEIDVLADVNARLSDAVLDDIGDPRTPSAHDLGGVLHTADALADLNTRITDATLDDIGDPRTPSAHTIVSHSDTTATGAELETLTDGSDSSVLHVHTIVSLDTTATGAELTELTNASETTLHSHASAGGNGIIYLLPHSLVGEEILATNLGDYAAAKVGDSAPASDGSVFFTFAAPPDFDALIKATVYVSSSATGNLDWFVQTDLSAPGEDYFQHSDGIGAPGAGIIKGMTASKMDEIDITEAFTPMLALDVVGVEFWRQASEATDTITSFWVLGLQIEYST